MAEPLPQRLAGYGAYNLCFDRLLGRLNTAADPDFFKTIRQQLRLARINLVRVICFRHSQKEDLPASRAIPLYAKTTTPTGSRVVVNEEFLDNLEALVASAQESNFWVQVSIFHFHAIATPKGTGPEPKPELPELLPLNLAPVGDTPCERLKNFFHPAPAKPGQLARQKELTAAVVGRLKGRPKVIYEIGNELRMDFAGCKPEDNCQLAEWMNVIKDEILRVDPTAHVGTSTGKHGARTGDNEEEIFSTCPKKLVPHYFDFHSGEWMDDDLTLRIRRAVVRARGYLGVTTTPPLIINDDGAHDENRTAENVQKWCTAAFRRGLHYAAKNTYPNGGRDEHGNILDFNKPVIRAINAAARDVPLPTESEALDDLSSEDVPES